ncbi:hypothetical protein LTR35_010322 [Friedmanniomyces endolithicus]|uniref:Inhibitor I9 domain-containing protein n=1 Tax=Friedmanniomyces endolithicus TaxID=329885 RepID=A0AAN6J2I8_9PEZI|nr:hypothetical protein LTS00_016387 [Friedmanniomyces endolithicus]KAK0276928.1 hypothetical protein LTR35_010322 [Friedmanniomyces endolithicus]KAK0308699.1 hypothetical protein LTR82_015389 [Friedmanniomyces endolithicus]KAK0992021.1 hypothetical protein LTR54_011527 [Friedmanniomyces endolithicus]KAK1062559.1 hypothetical protein LTR74_010139 [Friedmanniomyces endolithicus]
MPSINVSLKDGAGADQLDAAKKQVTDQGGKITNEFKLIKGFTYDHPATSRLIPLADDMPDYQRGVPSRQGALAAVE